MLATAIEVFIQHYIAEHTAKNALRNTECHRSHDTMESMKANFEKKIRTEKYTSWTNF